MEHEAAKLINITKSINAKERAELLDRKGKAKEAEAARRKELDLLGKALLHHEYQKNYKTASTEK